MITLALLTKYLNTCLARVWRALQAAGPSRTQMFPRSTRAGGKNPSRQRVERPAEQASVRRPRLRTRLRRRARGRWGVPKNVMQLDNFHFQVTQGRPYTFIMELLFS